MSNKEEIDKAVAAAAEASKAALKEARELVIRAAHLTGSSDTKSRSELLRALQELHLALAKIVIS